jgi:hypothetical protein
MAVRCIRSISCGIADRSSLAVTYRVGSARFESIRSCLSIALAILCHFDLRGDKVAAETTCGCFGSQVLAASSGPEQMTLGSTIPFAAAGGARPIVDAVTAAASIIAGIRQRPRSRQIVDLICGRTRPPMDKKLYSGFIFCS